MALAIWQELAEYNAGSSFHFEVLANGRVHGSLQECDVKITFGLGNYSAIVQGNSHESVLEEYIRRNGWERRHAPLALAAPAPVSEPTMSEPLSVYDMPEPPPEVPGDASDSENPADGMPVSESLA